MRYEKGAHGYIIPVQLYCEGSRTFISHVTVLSYERREEHGEKFWVAKGLNQYLAWLTIEDCGDVAELEFVM